jgi:predicted dehydrogenase/nucleoside-diphosphate-sugar epimerase
VTDFAQSICHLQKRICIVGTGCIAHTHAEAIRNLSNLLLTAVVDRDANKARQFAEKWGAERVYTHIEEALEQRGFNRAHVAVPPDAHTAVTLQLLASRVPTLVEKPLASSVSEANHLVEAAHKFGTKLGVNQNAIFYPAFLKLTKHLSNGEIGRIEHVDAVYNMPLRQLAARQFSHWMFAEPKNILLEQAVHPLSQILTLIGPIRRVEATAGTPHEIGPGVAFYSSSRVIMQSEHAAALLWFAVGASYPFWQVKVVGTDGSIVADMIRNSVVVNRRYRWLDPVDHLFSGLSTAGQIARYSIANGVAYSLSISGLARRNDAFFRSMASRIEAFHLACDNSGPMQSDCKFGASLVSVCEQIADTAFQNASKPGHIVSPSRSDCHDIAILGGTGFIGRAVVSRLIQEQPELRIGVMSRNVANLPEVFHQDQVDLIPGDVTSEEDISNAINSARVVINLAHGGGGDTWLEVKRRMVDSARNVASTCLAQKTELLVHIGSIAGLYLGDKSEVITGQTLPDPECEKRAPYARAKAMADKLMMEWNRERGLPVCILRPGIVVGEGTSPFHSGLGFFNSEQHCLGWNSGRNPLPFVLVEDVADAIARAVLKPELAGRSLNLVGDVTMTAREYIEELSRVLARPLRFHGQLPEKLFVLEWSKWGVKRLAGRKPDLPSYRDFRSRGCWAPFDCSDAKAALSWTPVSNRQIFVDRAICVHAANL